MRIKGAKNKATIEMERLIAEGMDPVLAKIRAKENVAKLKLALKDTPKSERKPRKPPVRKKGEKKEPTEKIAKVSKKDLIIPQNIQNLNASAKSAWIKSQTTNSRKNAIRAMCLMCVGGSVKEVRDCTMPTCPLFKYRITG